MSGGGRTYTWDSENRPSQIVSGAVTETYAYDADGERVVRTAGGVTTVYFEGVWEQTTTGARKLYYTFNGAVAAVRDSSSGLSYLHADHLGSIGLATSSTGTLASRQDYDPWGAVRSGNLPQTTLGFTGQRRDGTGLLYYHARMYDPVLARFVSADSCGAGHCQRQPPGHCAQAADGRFPRGWVWRDAERRERPALLVPAER
ncbi:MAG: RHS repeat-associated core domain-containing protein [Kouleothrix sp.]